MSHMVFLLPFSTPPPHRPDLWWGWLEGDLGVLCRNKPVLLLFNLSWSGLLSQQKKLLPEYRKPITICLRNLKIFKVFKFKRIDRCFAWMYVCLPLVSLVFVEARKGYRSPHNKSYRSLWVTAVGIPAACSPLPTPVDQCWTQTERDPPASDSLVLGSKVCATTGWHLYLINSLTIL